MMLSTSPRRYAAGILLSVCALTTSCGQTDRKPDRKLPEQTLHRSCEECYANDARAWRSDEERDFATGKNSRPGPDFTRSLQRRAVRIAMRDGVELHTEIYTPRVSGTQTLPIILMRTPYDLALGSDGYSKRLRAYPEFVKRGYILVFQNTRGRGSSGGRFVTLGPVRDRADPNATDESTDAFDTIEWLVRNVARNNGRVGMLGVSYAAFLTTRALLDPHPALRAASPQATCADMFVGDDWHRNGAFRLEYAFGWVAANERDLVRGRVPGWYDNYEAFLRLGALANIDREIFRGQAPSWNAFVLHPNLDEYWELEMCGVLPHIQPVKVPTLNVAGWFDAEDFFGPIEVYRRYEATDRTGVNSLVVGPWYHGGWSYSPTGRRIGPLDLGSDTARWFREEIHEPWFAHWLKDAPAPNVPEVLAFRTGANIWDTYESWPPTRDIRKVSVYLHAGGTLQFRPPQDNVDSRDEYVSDPASPVPYRKRPITYAGWAEWQLEDQRLAHGRPDVLSYVSEPLQHDLTISGEPIAKLFASSDGTDADWIVKLIDVYPQNVAAAPTMNGYMFLVAAEVMRSRFRQSFSEPKPIEPGKPTPYEINLRSRNHTFCAGHRIMVQIQSTWFPLIDRNPQKFVRNIYAAQASDYVSAVHDIYRSAAHPSHIELPSRTLRNDAPSCVR